MKKQNQKDNMKNNVIDITARAQDGETIDRMKSLKARFDLEHAKIALSTSLLSVVVLVTLANKNLMSGDSAEPVRVSRAIASVPTGTSDAEDSLVRALAKKELGSHAIGRRPSSLEALRFGTLEGKYAIRLSDEGKLAELEFTSNSESGDLSETDRPKHIQNRAEFISQNHELMPVAFDKAVWIEVEPSGDSTTEIYQLVNEVSRPVGTVEFKLDKAGRMLSMKVATLKMATAAN
jgi:hypothetical protein